MDYFDRVIDDYTEAENLGQMTFNVSDFDETVTDQGKQFGMVGNVAVPLQDDTYITGSIKRPGAEPPLDMPDESIEQGSISRDIGRGAVRGVTKGLTDLREFGAEVAGAPADAAATAIKLMTLPQQLFARAMGVDANAEIQNPIGGSASIKAGLQSIGNWMVRNIPGMSDVDETFRGYIEEKPENKIVQEIVQELTRFGTGAVLGPVQTARLLASSNPILRGMAWGGLTDFIQGGTDEQTGFGSLAEALGQIDPKERPGIARNVFSVVTKYEKDPAIVQRAKQTLDGFVIGGIADGLITLVAKYGRKVPWKTLMAGGAASMVAGDEAEAGPLTAILRAFTRKENEALRKAAGGDKKMADQAKREAARIKLQYPPSEGWEPIEATGIIKNKAGQFKDVRFRQPAYAFHKPAKKVSVEEHRANLADKMVNDVNAVVERARGGDEAAQEIVRQARWYRDMRSRLRAEFGGMADVFADLLGATSAQTGVEQNYRNSVEILRRFSRGQYDREIAAYQARVDAGETVNPKLLMQMSKEGDFPLIRSAAGALFNTNSPAATSALLDMFRQIKVGSSPKTVNFTANLIGFGTDATIDVWAARYLRAASGMTRLPPPAEKNVAGKHLTGSTLENPKIGGEFAFGQDVFADAANIINKSNVVKEYDPNLGDLGPDDLQAMVWFLEKEKWTKNGWTSKAGEGGSLDFESSLAGAGDPEAITAARRAATATFKPPKQRKAETDADYQLRVDEARQAFDEQAQEAAAQVQEMAAPLDRTVVGVARERPGQRPTNIDQAELASEITAPLRNDDTVVAFQANNTYGEFAGEAERALNAEIVTRSNHNPAPLERAVVEAGVKYDQDAVFISKVLRAPSETSVPGVEIYFRRREGVDVAQQITALLREKGVDGFTFITDARQGDRVDVQALQTGEEVAGLVGIRFQYIPAFDDGYTKAAHTKIIEEKEDIFRAVIEEMVKRSDIAAADLVHYDTKVFRRATDTDWMSEGVTYDEYLRTTAGEGNSPAGRGQLRSEGAAPPDIGGK